MSTDELLHVRLSQSLSSAVGERNSSTVDGNVLFTRVQRLSLLQFSPAACEDESAIPCGTSCLIVACDAQGVIHSVLYAIPHGFCGKPRMHGNCMTDALQLQFPLVLRQPVRLSRNICFERLSPFVSSWLGVLKSSLFLKLFTHFFCFRTWIQRTPAIQFEKGCHFLNICARMRYASWDVFAVAVRFKTVLCFQFIYIFISVVNCCFMLFSRLC